MPVPGALLWSCEGVVMATTMHSAAMRKKWRA